MSLDLPTPDAFPAFPYSPPYDIQVDLMRHLYTSIEQRKVTIIESPTGTGKTLSLLCASLTWLADERSRARKGKLAALAGAEDVEGPDWVAVQTRKRIQREYEAKEHEYNERLAKARQKEMELKKRMKTRVVKKIRLDDDRAKPAVEEENDDIFLPDNEEPDEDDNLSPAVKALMAKYAKGTAPSIAEEEELTCTKIYYASRTHSQLMQVVPELQRLKLSVLPQESCSSNPPTLGKRGAADISEDDVPVAYTRTVSLGSRRQLCVNEDLRRKKKDLDEACRELLDQKGDNRCQYLPTLDDEDRILDFRDQILAVPKDIEELATAGSMSNICPYFGSRRAIPQAELVTLPYNLLLQKSAREALGIDLTDQVVIIDEAHNLIPTLLSLSTHKVSFQVLATSYHQVCAYVSKFRNRLAPDNILHLKRLVAFLDALKKYLLTWKEADARKMQKVEIMSVAELVGRLGTKAASINLLDVSKYMKKSKIARKIASYSDKESDKQTAGPSKPNLTRRGAIPPLNTVEDFLLSLTSASDDGRVSLSLVGPTQDVEIKYQLLNPSPSFLEVVDVARSVVLAGGTMSPISDVVNQLFATVPTSRVTSFSCGHIIPSSNLLGLTISKGPTGTDLEYKSDKQSEKPVINELGQIVSNFINVVPSGMIVFFPSYKFLNTAKDVWKSSGQIEKFGKKKAVFFEPEEATAVESVMQEYAAAVCGQHDGVKGAVLFAVIGAKLSEGLNFADDLARAVVIVGLPFANLGSPELRERMKYVKRLEQKGELKRLPGQKDAAAELYENMCMNAVNQSIGRAIRHKGDWAALVLLDRRYSSSAIKNKLPKRPNVRQAMKEMGSFYRNKKASV
ncbi:helicase C-terminal domain-containing protein [Mucidula mucida]|nr:helicase C-terminal domain-containing protein [Mucidula mucida]